MGDRYEIKERLGRGGIGAVYRAYDTRLGREVAVKRLLPIEETNLNESAESTLAAEARALAALSHPNIVTIYEFAEDDEGSFVVFELIDGDTLKVLIDEGALAEEEFLEVADQMLNALIEAQKLDILHRDIKPANVMLKWLPSGRFQIKILDFGLAKFSEQPSLQTLDQSGSFLGSIDYIAPEQIRTRPLDQRTDLYSLGCLLYYTLTQQPPFAGKNPAETMDNHLKGNVYHLSDVRPDIPPAIANWVMKLISRLPDDRPADALNALELLERAKSGEEEPEYVAGESTEEEGEWIYEEVVEGEEIDGEWEYEEVAEAADDEGEWEYEEYEEDAPAEETGRFLLVPTSSVSVKSSQVTKATSVQSISTRKEASRRYSAPPKTGNNPLPMVWLALALMGLLSVLWVMVSSNAKKKEAARLARLEAKAELAREAEEERLERIKLARESEPPPPKAKLVFTEPALSGPGKKTEIGGLSSYPITHFSIENPGVNRVISLAEVEVIKDGVNIAPSLTVHQSSFFDISKLPARNLIDGDLKTFNHTRLQSLPRVICSFPERTSVDSIVFWGREGYEERFEGGEFHFFDGSTEIYGWKHLRPQIYSRMGEPALMESFDGEDDDSSWKEVSGEWVIEDGTIKGSSVGDARDAAAIRFNNESTNRIYQFRFRFSAPGQTLSLEFFPVDGETDQLGALFSLRVDEKKMNVFKRANRRVAEGEGRQNICEVKGDFKSGIWHEVVFERKDKRVFAQLNSDGSGQTFVMSGGNEAVAIPTESIDFRIDGDGVELDEIAFYRGE